MVAPFVNLVVADQQDPRVVFLHSFILLIFPYLGLIIGGRKGSAPGELQLPHGVAVDSQGRVIVADSDNNRVHVYNPAQGDPADPQRPATVTILGRSDSAIGSGVPDDGIADGWPDEEFSDPWAARVLSWLHPGAGRHDFVID